MFVQHKRFELQKTKHASEVSFDERGPSLGPIRLLEKTRFGFEPRTAKELDVLLGWTFGHPVSCKAILSGLETIARALNAGETARAMIATQFLHLTALNSAEARRAANVVALLKAAPDTPGHPGWPAGTPGGRGGKFMPKDVATESTEGNDTAESQAVQSAVTRRVIASMERKIAWKAVKLGLRRIITWKRLLRFLGEGASNAVPGLDVFGDAAMAYDFAEAAGDVVELRNEANIARAFMAHGPYTLDELRVASEDRAFSSMRGFTKIEAEKIYGPAGIGREYHHIVPSVSSGSIPARLLHSTTNVIRLPILIHRLVTEEYATLARERGLTIGEYFGKMSFEEQQAIGFKILREMCILK